MSRHPCRRIDRNSLFGRTEMADSTFTKDSTILFRGQYVFRSRNGVGAMAIGLSVSIVFAIIAAHEFRGGDGLLSLLVGSGFAIMGLVFGGLGLFVLHSWIGNKCERVQIDDEGITYRNRFTPWTKICAFNGTRFDNGIRLGYTPKARCYWGNGSLPTTPLLTEQQYRDLAKQLHSHIGHRFPKVVVGMFPVESIDGC